MITFGFRNRLSGPVRAVSALVLGIVMAAFPGVSLEIMVKILAVFIMASGVVSLVFGVVNRNNGGLGLMITNAIVDIVLGLVIFMFPGQVAKIVIAIIGVLLMVFGIFQISALLSANRIFPVGPWAFLMPVLCTAGGALVVFHPFGLGELITLVAGIALIVYGISEIVSSWKMRKAMDEYEIRFGTGDSAPSSPSGTLDSDDSSGIKDVDYEKVD